MEAPAPAAEKMERKLTPVKAIRKQICNEAIPSGMAFFIARG